MRHGVNKVRFKGGRDSTRSISRKLILAFLEHGYIETSVKRAKVLRSLVDRLVYKASRGGQSDKNVLLRSLGDDKATTYLLTIAGPALKGRTSGYVKIVRTRNRRGDNVPMAKVSWSTPVTVWERQAIPVKMKKAVKADVETKKQAIVSKTAIKTATKKPKVTKKV